MRCLFCKDSSENSKSHEHIIPESLGNTTAILPPGIVCDSCNNYFARKVEKPFLESLDLVALRFHQMVPNKKGRVPPLLGTLAGAPATVHRYIDNNSISGLVSVPFDTAMDLIKRGKGAVILPASGDNWEGYAVGRFLAKAALESMADRLIEYPEGLEYLVSEVQLDPIRTYARRGEPASWRYYCRRIYDADERRITPGGEARQVVWESDLLQTPRGEWYFILAIFGLELSINLGAPSIDGYIEWLRLHSFVSPLYFGKNAQA